jgi:transcriptional repressor NrdR
LKCPKCANEDTKVLESRISHEGRSVRRRRECHACAHRFTTYEKEESFVFSIRKKDGRVEPYLRDKIMRAVQIACQKRPVSQEQLEMLIANIETTVQEKGDRTIPSKRLGDIVMDGLQNLDKVAYVRFASVYKDFKDPLEFMQEINSLAVPTHVDS